MICNNLKDLSQTAPGIKDINAYYWNFRIGDKVDYSICGRQKNLLHIIASGTRHYRLESKEFTLSAGTVLFIPEHTRYITWNDSECSGIGVSFSFTENISIKENVYFNITDESGAYMSLFRRISDSIIVDPKAILHHTSLVYRILDHMCSELDGKEQHIKLLEPALALIRDKYRENISVKEYSNACNLSESYFRRIFKEQIGMSPIKYRNALRYEKAKQMITQGFSVSEIADSLGFCDPAYLRRLFRRDTGEALRNCKNSEFV